MLLDLYHRVLERRASKVVLWRQVRRKGSRGSRLLGLMARGEAATFPDK